VNAPALRIAKAGKRYGPVTALDALDMEVTAGEWLGLLGPNGAGKTTVMLAVAGLVRLDYGSIEIFGKRSAEPNPEQVGYVPQEIALYPQLTARENLTAFARLHGVRRGRLESRLVWALEWTGLAARADHRVASYSSGMKRRLNIACGVLHRPPLVLLDEPTVGVDPQARERIFTMLDQLRTEGTTLIHSTHELRDVETTCDRLLVIDHGRAIAVGTPRQLVHESVGDHAWLSAEFDRPLGEVQLDAGLNLDGNRLVGELADVSDQLPRLLGAIRDSGRRVVSLDVRRPGLAEVFVRLTGRDLRE